MKTLRAWRAERLLGSKALAATAGVSNKTIIDIEHGRQLPRFRTIQRLRAALGVEPREVEEFARAIDLAGEGEGRGTERSEG